MSAALLPPELRARLSGLRLSARRHAAGRGLGAHASRSRGAGLEFAQYRAYEPGDDLRQVDWKLVARSDRFFVRDAERDSPLSLFVLIDATASMAQRDSSGPSRIEIAAQLAAAAVDVASRQNDTFGLALLQAEAPVPISIGAGPRHRDRVFHALQSLSGHGADCPQATITALGSSIPASAVVLVLSDGFDEAIIRFAERLAATGRDLRFGQLLCLAERDFPFQGVPQLRDPETGEARSVDAASGRAAFLQAFGEAQASLARRLSAAGMVQCIHYPDRDLLASLSALCAPRF